MKTFIRTSLSLLLLTGLTACTGVTPVPDKTPTPVAAAPSTAPPPTPTERPATVPPTPTQPQGCAAFPRPDDGFLVIGYLPDYRTLDPSWGACLTDLVYFSAEPLDDGTLDTSRLNPATLQALQEMKTRYNTRLHLSVGGWGHSDHFAKMVASQTARRSFVNQLAQFCAQNGLDGVDFDWEFPQSEAETHGYLALIGEVRQKGLLVSVALYPDETLSAKQYQIADRIHIMSYDRGDRHSTFEQAALDLQFFVDSGIPKQKLVLGLPFYGREIIPPHNSQTYAELEAQYRPTPDLDEAGGFYFNGINTLQRKTCYARSQEIGGVMIWELGQDTTQSSLLQAVYQAAAGECPSPQ